MAFPYNSSGTNKNIGVGGSAHEGSSVERLKAEKMLEEQKRHQRQQAQFALDQKKRALETNKMNITRLEYDVRRLAGDISHIESQSKELEKNKLDFEKTKSIKEDDINKAERDESKMKAAILELTNKIDRLKKELLHDIANRKYVEIDAEKKKHLSEELKSKQKKEIGELDRLKTENRTIEAEIRRLETQIR